MKFVTIMTWCTRKKIPILNPNQKEMTRTMYASRKNRRIGRKNNNNNKMMTKNTNPIASTISSTSRKFPKITICSNHPFLRINKVILIMVFLMILSPASRFPIGRRRKKSVIISNPKYQLQLIRRRQILQIRIQIWIRKIILWIVIQTRMREM